MKHYQILDAQSSAGSAPALVTDGFAIPQPHAGDLWAHMQIEIAGGTTVTYQASLWVYRPELFAIGGAAPIASSGAWLRAFQSDPGIDTSETFLARLVGEWTRAAIVLDAVAGSAPDINAAIAFSKA